VEKRVQRDDIEARIVTALGRIRTPSTGATERSAVGVTTDPRDGANDALALLDRGAAQ